jgi:hypothetical protein
MIDVFRGYNHNLRIGEGEFYDMKNLTSNDYPVLSPRERRGIYKTPGVPQGMVAKDSLCYVDGGDFIIGEERIPMGLTVQRDADGNIIPKNLISMGAYVIIMPDKRYINTSDLTDYGPMEPSVTTSETVTFTPCSKEGVDYLVRVGNHDYSPYINEEVKGKEAGTYWYDTSLTPPVLKEGEPYNWQPVERIYIKISSPGIGIPFEEGDLVLISGIEDDALQELNADVSVLAKGDDYIVVESPPASVVKQETPITIAQPMPTMDFIIESANRLWGCHYGQNLDGDFVNEIYASKLGDFKKWDSFAGVSLDSYAVTVGSDGPFTGAIAFRGTPIFFKEGCMHKIYGNYPANYQVLTTACRGLQKGCSRSLAIVNETLYYKSRSAVCAYDGALPYEISAPLGDEIYDNATAGALGNKYYISMRDSAGKYNLFVYDVQKGMWHREDNTRAIDFCSCGGELYYLDPTHNHIKSIRGTGELEASPVEWEAVTGVIGTDSPDKKYISRLDVRMSLELGARVYFFVQYNSIGAWEPLGTMTGTTLQSFGMPMKPRRCDHLRLKIVGVGEAKIYSICKTISGGSDV